jgi:hypothetical protein
MLVSPGSNLTGIWLVLDDGALLLKRELFVIACVIWSAAPVCGPRGAAAQMLGDTAAPIHQRTIRVGPQHSFTTIRAAAAIAQDGDIVEIESGEYPNDVAVWAQSNLVIRGVGGRARIVARGESAEGKAIWVIKGNNVLIENVAFAGARVANRNGAGIRHEGGKLILRKCLFEYNEMGVLTWNNAAAELEIDASEFRHNSSGPIVGSLGHQIYVGSIRRFELQSSYVHHGAFGHLVKSRAAENHIYYNRLTDEAGGRSSYELEFPNGGLAYVIGNIIQQSPLTENPRVVAFGAEGYKASRNELYFVNNTVFDELSDGGVILAVRSGATIKAMNNLLLGKSEIEAAGPGQYAANYSATSADVAMTGAYEYRLRNTSRLVGAAVDPGYAVGIPLRPEREYVHPTHTNPVTDLPQSPGAIQSFVP